MNYRLKHFLKKNALVSRIGYAIREYKTKKAFLMLRGEKTDNSKILFASGRYGDSLSRVLETLHDLNNELHFVWAYRSGDRSFLDEYPEYVKPVLFESSEYYYEMATSKAWVFNVLVPQGTVKRSDQLYIQVWHGDKPFKKIGNEAASDKKGYRNQSNGRKFSEKELCDYFVTGSKLFIDIWNRSMGYDGKVIGTGLPRNDVFLKDNHLIADQIREELGISSEFHVLLYAPTFRDHIADNSSIGTDINLSEALNCLEERFGEKWICLKRSHGGSRLILNATGNDGRIIDVSQYRDMTNLMLISDILITDYSSCAGDFAYTGRPVLLYQDDYESYVSRDRSLIFDMKKTPFLVAHNMTELAALIRDMNVIDFGKNDREILELYQSIQTDHASEDVAKIILDYLNT